MDLGVCLPHSSISIHSHLITHPSSLELPTPIQEQGCPTLRKILTSLFDFDQGTPQNLVPVSTFHVCIYRMEIVTANGGFFISLSCAHPSTFMSLPECSSFAFVSCEILSRMFSGAVSCYGSPALRQGTAAHMSRSDFLCMVGWHRVQ